MTHGELLRTLRERLAAKLGVPSTSLELTRELSAYGLDSLEAVNLTGELEVLIGRRIEPTAAWEHPTLWDLSVHLAELAGLDIELPEAEEDLDTILASMAAGAERA